MIDMQEIKCKYCGGHVPKNYETFRMCTNCYNKLPLVRELLQMVKDTFEMYGGKNNG